MHPLLLIHPHIRQTPCPSFSLPLAPNTPALPFFLPEPALPCPALRALSWGPSGSCDDQCCPAGDSSLPMSYSLYPASPIRLAISQGQGPNLPGQSGRSI